MRNLLRTVMVPLCLTLVSCSESAPQEEDLGNFLPSKAQDTVSSDKWVDYEDEDWTHMCKPAEDPSRYHYLYVGGQLVETTPEYPIIGVPVPGVTVEFYDMCHVKFEERVTQNEGSVGFQIKIDNKGFDGYIRYTKENYPLFVTFDKPFSGFVMVNKIRMFSGVIFDAPISIVGQDLDLGYIQGTVYNLVDEKAIPGAVVTATSGGKPNGIIGYLGDSLPIPMMNLTQTGNQGVFFVVNATPGKIVITATLPDGRVFQRPAMTWPVNSWPTKSISQVGIPVYPDSEYGVTPDW